MNLAKPESIVKNDNGVAYNSSNADMNKISAMYVDGNGNLYSWVVESLDYAERFNVIYPLKSE